MALRAVGLRTHIWNNFFKSIVLLVCYPFILMAFIWVVCFTLALPSLLPVIDFDVAVEAGNLGFQRYWYLAVVAAGAWYVIAYARNAQLIRLSVDAEVVNRKDAPNLYNMLENLCIECGMEMPYFQVVEMEQVNAFASGIDRKSYAITLTRGLLNYLEPDEVRAVIAHELTHIRNGDSRMMMINYMFCGMISFLADVLYRLLYRMSDISDHRKYLSLDSGVSSLVLSVVLVPAVVVLQSGRFFAMTVKFAFSQRREYLADAGAVELTRDPEAVMRALSKIGMKASSTARGFPNGIRSMCIHNIDRSFFIFRTHPPIEKRVLKLSRMTATPVPEIKVSLRHPMRRRKMEEVYDPFTEISAPRDVDVSGVRLDTADDAAPPAIEPNTVAGG